MPCLPFTSMPTSIHASTNAYPLTTARFGFWQFQEGPHHAFYPLEHPHLLKPPRKIDFVLPLSYARGGYAARPLH